MRYKRMISVVKSYGYDIKGLLSELKITVLDDSSLNKKDKDALLITGKTKSTLFVRNDINDSYRDFLILHECGHRLFHFREDSQYSYMQSQYTGRMEHEANIFACLYLLQDENLEDMCVIDVLQAKGVPRQIAIKFVDGYRQRL